MARRSSPDPDASQRGLQAVTHKIAERYGVPVTDVRYAEYRCYISEVRWTTVCVWERRIDGAWREEPMPLV
jgi:hypothetical protein